MKKLVQAYKRILHTFILLVSVGTLLFSQGFVSNPYALSRPPIVGSSPFQDSLWGIDSSSLNVRLRHGPILSGFTITGMTSVTMHPHTGEHYVIMKLSAVSGRVLGKINILTGVCTQVGNLGDNFSTISFREDGQLFGVTGDGATVPETMYLIDHTNGTKTLAAALGAGADGEVIAYNYDDNFIYHWSGNGTVVYEKVLSVPPYTTTNIPIIGTTNGETFGGVYIGNNRFITSNIASSFNRFNTAGNVTTAFGSNPDDLRGLALIPRWVTGPLVETTSICANDTVTLQALATPNDGNRHKFQWVLNGTNIPGATSSTFNVTQASGSGRYNCRIMLDSLNANNQTMDSAITAYTDTAWFGRTIIFNPNPGLNPSPIDYLCSATDTVVLVNSNNQGTNQWYLNGVALAGETNDTLWATAVGDYNVTATVVAGCADTMAVATSVSIAPTATLTSTTNQCFGDSVLLTANAGSSNYDWLLNGALSTSTASEMLYISADGNYSVVTTFGNCLDTSNVEVVDFAPQYNVTPTGTGSICIGSNQLLTATAGGTAYQWLMNGAAIGGATTSTFTATATGTYACLISFPGCTDTTVTTYNLTAVDCSGIEENTSTIVSVYPNPVHTQLNISISNNTAIQQIEIIDLSGRKVISVKPNGSNASINVEDLRSGTYLITVTTENGVKTKRFVKN